MDAKKYNYEEIIERPSFIQTVTKQKMTRGNKPARPIDGKTIYEEVHSDDSLPNLKPADLFDIFMPKHAKRQSHPDTVTIADFTSWTNKKILLANAGRRQCLS